MEKNKKLESNIDDILKKLEFFLYKRHLAGVFSDIICIAALTLSIRTDLVNKGRREKELAEIQNRYEEKELQHIDEIVGDIFNVLIRMGDTMEFDDHLGKLFMLSETGNKHNGQFFTPYQISLLMAQITFDPDIMADKEFITVGEPTCGSGGTILAYLETLWKNNINYTVKVVIDATDIDYRCVAMTYLQLSFVGAAAIIRHGNSLTQQFLDAWITPALLLQPQLMKDYLDKTH